MRLIDADELVKGIDIISKLFTAIDKSTQNIFDAIKAFVESSETIEAEPIRRGKWVFKKNEDYVLEVLVCSNCGCSAYEDINGNDVYSNYCPDCGAKMD